MMSDLCLIFYDFPQVSSFCLALLVQLLNPCYIISVVTALQDAPQLEVASVLLCVLRDIHRPVHFASPAAGIVCYFAAILLAVTNIALRRLVGAGGAPGRPTLWRVGVVLARLLRHHRPPRRRSA